MSHESPAVISLRKLGTAWVVLTMVLAWASFSTAGAAGKYRVLHRFGRHEGLLPYGGLVFDGKGNLFGTTRGGGVHLFGTVYELTPNGDGTWKESLLYEFSGADGRFPVSTLIFDSSGNLYGTTYQGGANDYGTVFQLSPNGDGTWKESVLHSFNISDGAEPTAGLVFDGAGNLYGTAGSGGSDGGGTVFELTPNGDGTWTESVLHSFSAADGRYPNCTPILDSAGNLYGTTYQVGPGGFGTVFELTPNGDGTWKEQLLHSFTGQKNGQDGAWPNGALVFDTLGNLYGATSIGGSRNHGTVFELIPNGDGTWRESVLHSFDNKDGAFPAAPLVQDPAGSLYGTTAQGGDLNLCQGRHGRDGCGLVFKLTANGKGGWSETVLHRFLDRPNALPVSGVILDASGNLYGTDLGFSSSFFGSVFQIAP